MKVGVEVQWTCSPSAPPHGHDLHERLTVKATEDELIKRITIDPAICHGKPCVRGLRYPVETVLQWLSSGMSYDEILGDYPDLEHDDIMAVLLYASRLSQVKRITRTA